MDKLKNYFSTRTLGFFVTIPAIIFAVAGLLVYRTYGATEFSPTLSVEAQAGFVAGIVLCVVSLVLEYRPVRFFGYLALLYACLKCLAVQATYIVNVFVSIDGNTFSDGFIMTVVFSVLAWLTALVAVILTKERKKGAVQV